MPEKISTRYGDIAVEKRPRGNRLKIILSFDSNRECVFHWGLSGSPGGAWLMPPEEIRPEKTRTYGDQAAQTSISHNGSLSIELEAGEYSELYFVLYFPGENEWDNNQGKNYRIRLSESGAAKEPSEGIADEALQEIAAEIILKETGDHSWTLMHRYNFCHELLERIGGSRKGLALLFVWLRFSALRQLDWQRNYNTQPRELGHAQQRLAERLAKIYTEAPAHRDLVRLMLTTIGHGGEGQKIRDEILEIMHRYGIKEVSEIFMEQWHQKMHNNTTPDDIVICEAYLAFLRSNGDPDIFYRTLEAGGVTRQRLESYERPIIAEPQVYSDNTDAMIRDFEHFLGTVKSVHSAADLGICIQAARRHFDGEMHRAADFIWDHRDAAGREAVSLLREAGKIRRRTVARLDSDGAPVDLLRLDIAVEDFVRLVVERSLQSNTPGEALLEWLALVLDHFLLAHDAQDLSLARRQWNRIWESGPLDLDLTLQAESVLDRMERTVGDYAHGYQVLFQPAADHLGKAFHAQDWTIRLFSEEVVRGSPIFALSTLSHRLRGFMRRKAELPSWQLVSRGGGTGIVKVMGSLNGVQGRRFDPPVIIVSDRIEGDEDLAEGVIAVLTPGSVDVVSHVAIRARNQGVLLAVCYDDQPLDALRSFEDKPVDLEIAASGDVRFKPAKIEKPRPSAADAPGRPARFTGTGSAEPPDAPWAIPMEAFEKGWVGGKSLHLAQLRGKLPDWIRLPASAALPFGTFQKVLDRQAGRHIRRRYERLSAQVDESPDHLDELRKAIMDLEVPDDFSAAIGEAAAEAGIRLPQATEKVWACIKGVWASKWNARAYWNRKAYGIPHAHLLMAVLIQEVVAAEYAFIIHTVHPFSGDREEIYIEIVLGLGETLAGNYPGRAFSCTCRKGSRDIRLLAYPSKSIALYGGGVIFRSDSNAEDLAGYAGAGLYSSLTTDLSKEVHLDYTEDRLVQDAAFRSELLSKIAEVGLLIEKTTGSAQDIEGAFVAGDYYVVQTRAQVGLDV